MTFTTKNGLPAEVEPMAMSSGDGQYAPDARPGRRGGRIGYLLGAMVVFVIVVTAAIWLYQRASRAGAATGAARQPSAPESITVWGERYEVFLVYPRPAVGSRAQIACHVTDLETGRPVDSGTVEVQALLASGGALPAAQFRPARPGIFLIGLIFPQTGEYQLTFSVEPEGRPQETVVVPRFVVGESPAWASRAGALHQAGDEIAFTKEQQWRRRIRTERVARRTLVQRLMVPGFVRSPAGASALVTPPAAGTLFPPPGGRFPAVGEAVEQGEPLAVLEPTSAGAMAVQLLANRAQLEALDIELAVKQLQVETAAKVAQHELEVARRTLARVESLAAGGTTTARQLDQARLDVQVAEERYKGAQEQLQPYTEARTRLANLLGRSLNDATANAPSDLRILLTSPIQGTVVESHATAGQHLNVGDRVFQIVNLEKMWIEARVSEYDLGRIERAAGASYRLSAYPDEIVPILGHGGGRLVNVGSVVDPDNRTVPVRYEVPNPQGRLRVDMAVEVFVETGVHEQCLAVPDAAVLDEGAEIFVIVQSGGETFVQQPVTVGIRDAGWVEILNGLTEGQRIVTSGARAVRLAALGGEMTAHDHEH
jgi:RND family efflux transporter MFP subunit